MRPEISIVILTYNRPDLIEARLHEVARIYSGDPWVEVVAFNNGSTDSDTAGLIKDFRLRCNFPYTFINQQSNLGFGRGFNTAAGYASAPVVALLSNDVRVTGDFAHPVLKALKDGRRLVGHRLINWAAGWNQFGGRIIPYLEGYFLACDKQAWKDLGGFDAENFHPYDYEDIDLSYRAVQAGVDLLPLPALPLHHEPAQSIGYTPERLDHTVALRRVFALKHNLPLEPERP